MKHLGMKVRLMALCMALALAFGACAAGPAARTEAGLGDEARGAGAHAGGEPAGVRLAAQGGAEAQSAGAAQGNVAAAGAQGGAGAVGVAGAPEPVDIGGAVILTVSSPKAIVHGAETDLVAGSPLLSPYLIDGVTYVPLAFMESAFQLQGEQNAKGRLIVKSGGKALADLRPAQYGVAVGGGETTLYVPLRKLAEALGKSIFYSGGLIAVSDGGALFDAERDRAQIRGLRNGLTGARPVGDAETLSAVLSSADNTYGYFSYADYLELEDSYKSYYAGGGEVYYDVVEDAIAGSFDGQADFAAEAGAPAMAQPETAAAAEAPARAAGDAGSANSSANSNAGAGSAGGASRAAQESAVPATAPASAPVPAPEAEEDSAEAGGLAGDEYSSTNVQVQGVDESDIVKTDGRYIYQINGRRLVIVDAYPPSGMKVAGGISWEDDDAFSPIEMYVDGDTLVVIGSSGRQIGARPAFAGSSPAVPAGAAVRGWAGAEDAAAVEPTQTTSPATASATTTVPATAGEQPTSPADDSVAVTNPAAPAGFSPPVAAGQAAGAAATRAATASPALDGLQVFTTAFASTVAAGAAAVETAPAPAAEPAAARSDVIMPYPPQRGSTVKALAYDISDKAAAKLLRTTELDGYYKTSRKIGDSLYIVANKSFYEYAWYDGAGYGDAEIPPVEYRDFAGAAPAAGSASGEFAPVGYGRTYYFPGRAYRNYMAVAGVNVKDASVPASVQAVLASGDNVYASADYLYLAATEYGHGYAYSPYSSANGYGWGRSPTTAVHRFRLDGGAVEYDGMGEVNGTILNQFSMDQSGDYFRIATTSNEYDGKSGRSSSSNNLYVLDGDLGVAGRLEGLAPGEQIYSVRFMGDRAYVVTFKTVDPLFAIDLSDPKKPAVLGSLKIPGYSDYLHPYDENHLIGFGKDTVEYANSWDGGQSVSAYYQGMKIALFDVTDVSSPKELFKTSIGDRGTESPLLHNHKALLFSRERGLLAFPVTVMTVPESEKTGDYKQDSLQYGQFEFQGAYVYSLTLEGGFSLKGRITHISEDEYKKAGSYWYGEQDSAIERLLYIRDTLYALSQGTITASDIATVKETGRVAVK